MEAKKAVFQMIKKAREEMGHPDYAREAEIVSLIKLAANSFTPEDAKWLQDNLEKAGFLDQMLPHPSPYQGMVAWVLLDLDLLACEAENSEGSEF